MGTIITRKQGNNTYYLYQETYREKINKKDYGKNRGSVKSKVHTRSIYLGSAETILKCIERSFGINTINGIVKASADKQDFRAYLQSLDCTHILMRTELVNKYLRDNFPEKTIIRFLDLAKEYWEPVYESNGYMVMGVRNDRQKIIDNQRILHYE